MDTYKFTVTNVRTGEIVGIGFTGNWGKSKNDNNMSRVTFKTHDGNKEFQVNSFYTETKNSK